MQTCITINIGVHIEKADRRMAYVQNEKADKLMTRIEEQSIKQIMRTEEITPEGQLYLLRIRVSQDIWGAIGSWTH